MKVVRDAQAARVKSGTWFNTLSRAQKFGVMAVYGFLAGLGIETFMNVTGFYDVFTMLHGRRRYQQQQRAHDLDGYVEDAKGSEFQNQLELRKKVQKRFGITPDDETVPLPEVSEVPSFYNWARDKIFPPSKGEDRLWGPWDPTGKPRM
eukprot:Hpha_TRINITY_DN35204_c0_g1::TRINITY_DN35204_c0_g1_i1::g.145094::m.145094